MYYRVVLRDKTTGAEYTAQFGEVSYIDTIAFSDESRRYEAPVLRYLLATYVHQVTQGTPPRTLEFEEVLALPEPLIKLLVDSIIEKATLGSEERFTALVKHMEEQSLTLLGSYDVFLYAHLGPELYLSLLTQPPHIRAQVITLVEKTTGINVKERFDEAIKTGKPVDLITTGAAYEQQRRRAQKGAPPNRPPVQKYSGRFAPEQLPTDIDEMIEASHQSLSQALNAARQGKAEKFSWSREAAELSRFELERERALLNREKDSGS